ncbi:MAG: hypothetical protein KF760_02305 [Candidatus Eremiobacteraeota bacterium]|nr:hypothetical protein [Candidatus Eremiobacteraeota bacterium]MCW5868870.1 hypothetical protein [Candidatus Eremiobacteraeota bacterium]
MNVQSFSRFTQPKALKAPEHKPQPEAPEASKGGGSDSDFLEVFAGATLTGLACGLSANSLGAGWGTLASLPASTVAWGGYGYLSADKNGYEGLAAIGGGIAGLTFGAAGSVGAAVGSLAGHPVIGGVVGGALAGLYLGSKS